MSLILKEDSDHSQGEDGSINGGENSKDSTSRDELAELQKFVATENKNVGIWRRVVCTVIVVVGIGVTWMTHYFLTVEEKNSFEKEFDKYATTVIEFTRFNAEAFGESYDTLGDHFTSYSIQANSTWPMFTLPDLHVHGQNVLEQTMSLGFFATHYVDADKKLAWEKYTTENGDWYGKPFVPFIHHLNDSQPDPNIGTGPWGPIWECYPPPIFPVMNYDILPDQPNAELVKQLKHAVYGRTLTEVDLLGVFEDNTERASGEPFSTYFVPIFDGFDREMADLVGTITGFLVWGHFFRNILPEGVSGIHIVLDTGDCGQKFSWMLDGSNAKFLGGGDMHEAKYDEYEVYTPFGVYEDMQAVLESGVCMNSISVYPTSSFEDSFHTARPVALMAAVGAVFILVILSFFALDFFQTKRNDKVLATAAKTSAVVTSLFPAGFRDRILQDALNADAPGHSTSRFFASHNQRIKNFVDRIDEGDDSCLPGKVSKPIADFFPEVTVMFADIVGFTAWCSVREPSQVFELLESTYSAFDRIAKKRRVFKVETVGDCYVAAAGIPEKRKDHALVMARFAHACMQATSRQMKLLEKTLGPDTGDLTIRVGLHSGSVTAGILRGQRARMQLFGDTMNMGSRMESSGQPGRIHVSEDTAHLLEASGKSHWLIASEEKADIKGKGLVQTYWLNVTVDGLASTADSSSNGETRSESFEHDNKAKIEEKLERLIDWNVDVFSGLLKQIAAHRLAKEQAKGESRPKKGDVESLDDLRFEQISDEVSCLDEVKDIITLPKYDRKIAKFLQDPESIKLHQTVTDELREYIRAIALMYRENAFHNFEHASHVTMSVRKLLSRIVSPDIVCDGEVASILHDHTYGITSDPLTQFAVVFSALIHDVDHLGVPNTTLIQEKSELGALFKNKSVAEQNSIVLSWELLMDYGYNNLRKAIFSNLEEMQRFRQLVVQTVLATDIADKELKNQRNERWARAFSESVEREGDPQICVNRKATIVIEHLIQASDVSHTMQHWHIYRKWNESFFLECYQAYLDGRADKDPSESWYQGEKGFFDFYIIPLAKKLKDCGVFGVSSDEYLNYALKNRREWETRGEQVVAEMLENFHKQERAVKKDES